MKSKKILKAIIIATIAIAMIAGLTSCGNYSAETLVTNTTDVSQDFSGIVINTSDSDVYFQPSTDGKVSVVCRESKKIYHSVTVEENTLIIDEIDTRSDIEKLRPGISLFARTIIDYLPVGEYADLAVEIDTGDIDIPAGYTFNNVDIENDTGNIYFKSNAEVLELNTDTGTIKISELTATNIKLDTDTGDISVEDVSSKVINADTDTGDINILYSDIDGALNTSADTGKIQLTDVSCTRSEISNNTGKIVLHSLLSKEEIKVTADTGDIKLLYSDAPSIILETTTGDVHATILSDKQFDITTDVGDINIPEDAGEQTCKITTDTGDITVIVEKILVVE